MRLFQKKINYSTDVKYYIVVGASRGLGAALVTELLKYGNSVIGISRTKYQETTLYNQLSKSENFQYIELDITSQEYKTALIPLCNKLAEEPVCIIYNAACLESDLEKNSLNINHDIFKKINNVNINGLGNILEVFQEHLLKNGGTIVGISSFNALYPISFSMSFAYPASKAYMDMLLRSLRIIWKDKVNIVTIHLGYMKETSAITSPIQYLIPTYAKVAKKIIQKITKKKPSGVISDNWLYNLLYKFVLPVFPDNFVSFAVKTLLNGIIEKIKR